jgi:hypothetical protein
LKAAYAGAFAGGRAAAEPAVVLTLLALGGTGASWIARVMRDLPLPKTPEEVMLASQRRGIA